MGVIFPMISNPHNDNCRLSIDISVLKGREMHVIALRRHFFLMITFHLNFGRDMH